MEAERCRKRSAGSISDLHFIYEFLNGCLNARKKYVYRQHVVLLKNWKTAEIMHNANTWWDQILIYNVIG